MLDTTNLPSYQRPEAKACLADLALMSDLLQGTRRMHEQSNTYIRKWADESDDVYNIRRKMANLFGGLSRTLSAATGMLFAKAPSINWNQSQARIEPHWDNLDAMGTSGSVFAKRFAEQALRDGLAILLVDHTAPPDGVFVHSGNEEEIGLRPTWAMYQRCQAWSWRLGIVGNKRVLTQLVLHELVEIEAGAYGMKQLNQWRVLALNNGAATWKVFRQRASSTAVMSETDVEPIGAGVFKNKNGEVATALPVAIAYTGRTEAPLTAAIPLIDVAWANLAHWQQSTDLRFYRSLAAFPQPTVIGKLIEVPGANGSMIPGTLRVGPMVGVHLHQDGEFKWTELTGSSMDQIEKGIQDSERQISQLGLSFLFKDTRAPETAEAKRLDATAENSTLATAGQGIEDAINLAFEWHGWYMGIPKADCPVMSISKDFDNTAMDPATMAVYIEAVVNAGLPVRILLEVWKAGGRLPPDADLDALETEIAVNAAAIQKQKELAAEEDAARKLKERQPIAA